LQWKEQQERDDDGDGVGDGDGDDDDDNDICKWISWNILLSKVVILINWGCKEIIANIKSSAAIESEERSH
jgi:hypothetical protein